jgi:2-polyprenyl-3-methyl-5-hydroxy-6-metoxy-1,4-benzoquinol methylase
VSLSAGSDHTHEPPEGSHEIAKVVPVIPRAERLAELVRGPCVLDVGCAGHTLEPDSPHWLHGQLVKRFPGVMGIDRSEEKINELRSRGFDQVFVADAETFSLEQRFDTIVVGELIEHVSNPGLFLKQARSHLALGGQVVVSTPFPFSLLNFLYAYLKYPKTCQNLEHVHWFCVSTLAELAKRSGLRVSHWELIEDYRKEDNSGRYRAFVHLIAWFGWMLPKRLRCNSMVFVFESEADL